MVFLGKLSNALEKFAIVIATGLLIMVFCMVFSGVVFRVIGNSFSLSEELSRWGLISLCFIGASVALKQKLHVGVNMLIQALPLPVAKVGVTIAYIVVFFLLSIAGYFSLMAALSAKEMTGDIIPISMMYVKFSLPLGMFMMLVHLLNGFFGIMKAKTITPVLIGS
ncbi:MAG: TRAP transporter small permease subunit [Treponemataceae bacterium]